MERIQAPNKEALSQEHREIWDAIDGTRGGVWGPYAVLMHSPALCQRVAALGEQLRFHGVLPDQLRELAILTAARESQSAFEWSIHETIAKTAGATDELIEAVRSGVIEEEKNPRQIFLMSKVITELFRNHRIETKLFEEARAELGLEALIEIMVIAGFYRMLAFVLQGFEMDNPKT